jgi:hypothetical protein
MFGLTGDFLVFIGTTAALLSLGPVTILAGYFVSLAMEWLTDNVLALMGIHR